MLTLHRILQDLELKRFARNKTNLRILEIGAGKKSYRKLFRNCEFISTDIKKFPGVDEVADVTNLKYKSNSFDLVLCLSVLDDIFDFNKAISEIRRILKKGGKAVIYVPFLYPLHDVPHDYWRFTEFSLKHILKDFSDVKIKAITPTRLLWRFVLGYFVIAKK